MSESGVPVRLLYRPEEAAAVLGLGRTKVYELMASGELRSVKVGGARRVFGNCAVGLRGRVGHRELMASIERRYTSRGVRYDVRYREPGGRPRVKTWHRKADAVRFARSVEVDKDRGLFVDPARARTPLADVAALWLMSNPGKRGGSWQRDEIVVRRHIVPALGARPVGSLTPGDVQSLVNRWAGARAARTVHREYGVLRAILNYALANDMVGRTPCRGIKLPEVTRFGVTSWTLWNSLDWRTSWAGSGRWDRWSTSGRWTDCVGVRSQGCAFASSTSMRGRLL
jgi:excisionase family DNA binding protein